MYGDDHGKVQREARARLVPGLLGLGIGAALIVRAIEIRQLGGFLMVLLGCALVAGSIFYVVRWWRTF